MIEKKQLVASNLIKKGKLPNRYVSIIDNITDIDNNRWSFEYNECAITIVRTEGEYNILSDANNYDESNIRDFINIYDNSVNMRMINSESDLYVTDNFSDVVMSEFVCLASSDSDYLVEINDGTNIELKSYDISLDEGCKYRVFGLDVGMDYGNYSFNLFDTAVVNKIDSGYYTGNAQPVVDKSIDGDYKTCVNSDIVDNDELNAFEKTVGVKDGYIILDRTGFFQGDIITRDELIQGLFENSPKIYNILNNDKNNQLLDIFKQSYQSTDIIDTLDEYDLVSVKTKLSDVEYNSKSSNKPSIECQDVNDKRIVFWDRDYKLSEGDKILIILGSVSEYKDEKHINVSDKSVLVKQNNI